MAEQALSELAEDILRRAYERITPADRFCQGAYARDSAGRELPWADVEGGAGRREAATWCGLGAVWAEAARTRWCDSAAVHDAVEEVEEALDRVSRRLNPSHPTLECATDASDLPIAHSHALACMDHVLAGGKRAA